MLAELRVRDLGVIADLTLVLGPGVTALTGETGAGKTLVVEAIELLVGGRSDAARVRAGADEALVEGRFVSDGSEVVLARSLPAGGGRSRAYVDGRMAPVAALAGEGGALVDLHGQHAHQSLLAPAVQRGALDTFAATDLGPLASARSRLAGIDRAVAELGGDARERAREADLLSFQVEELERAALADPAEDEALAALEEALADAGAARQAAALAYAALAGEGGAVDRAGSALAALAGRPALAQLGQRLRSLQAELADAASELMGASEAMEDDPERLEAVTSRRHLLRDLRRKYGETLAEVMAYQAEASARLDLLSSHGRRAAELDAERSEAQAELEAAAAAVAAHRRRAAPRLAAAVQAHLRRLAMPRAVFEVAVEGPGPADQVSFRLAANPGEAPLPLAKVASGGELARVMLAARLVLTGAPPTLVFDEVDAGIGGEAALAVGRSLAELGERHQVLVVTHLPQVAAFADHQVAVTKSEVSGRSVADVTRLDGPGRVVELSRMLSGQPGSSTARNHAQELLASAARERRR